MTKWHIYLDSHNSQILPINSKVKTKLAQAQKPQLAKWGAHPDGKVLNMF